LKGEGDGRVNFLLLGRGGEGHDGADLTDTILLASIDPVNKKAALVSLPRDFWVTTPYGSSKVNAVFAYAKQRGLAKHESVAQAEADGVSALESVVQGVFNVPIHYYGIVDFSAFEQAVNAVGGVDVNVTPATAVTEHMWNESTQRNYYLNVQPGLQHFDGQEALFYTRSRHTSARGDFDRAERQRIFLEALVQKIASSQTYTNPVKISQLLSTIGSHISTDISLTDATRLMSIGRSIGGNFDSVDLAAAPNPLVRTSMVSGQSVVVPTAGVGNYGDIQNLIRAHLPDGYVVNENAPITILNGSNDPAAATKKAEELRSYGYNVGTVADAPTKTYQRTVLVDLSKGKKPYTKNYLQKRLGVTATTTLPDTHIQPGNASFAIIVGQQ
jgi:LCP family protein required for cell wall assembly